MFTPTIRIEETALICTMGHNSLEEVMDFTIKEEGLA
jgi:hypothetical protein